jgi:predicted lipoprotein with Yx(FWY)xxD motif
VSRTLTFVLIAAAVVAVTAGAAIALAPGSTTTAVQANPTPPVSMPPSCAPTPADLASPAAHPAPTASTVVTVTLGMVGTRCALIDSSGRSMYVYLDDTRPNQTSCDGSCALPWPPVPGAARAGKGLAAQDFGVVTRADGTLQASFHSRPLYYYTGDYQPGNGNGEGLGGVWFLVGPDGQPLQR